MSIFGCTPAQQEESRDKELLAPITQQLHAVSTVIDGLRQRVAELSCECNSRIRDCAVRVIAMEKRLKKITDPLDSMSNDELQRVLYILELIKKAQGRKRKARRVT
jgi:hypothetical protein